MKTIDHNKQTSESMTHYLPCTPSGHFRQKVIPFLVVHLEDPTLKIKDLCAYLHLSRTHLHRKLKRHCRMNFTQLLTELRMQRAKTLLVTSELEVSQIAYQVGFTDPSYFIRLFRKLEQVTPRRYRLAMVITNKTSYGGRIQSR